MNVLRITKKAYFVAILALPSIILGQDHYVPSRYEDLLTKNIESLQFRRKSFESKLTALKKRSDQPSKGKKVLQQGNQAVLESLTAAQAHINERLRALDAEKKKLKTLGIKNATEEDILMRKASLQFAIDDIDQKIKEAQRTEQFFEKQKIGKTRQEKDKLEKIKQSSARKREQLALKMQREQYDLNNLK